MKTIQVLIRLEKNALILRNSFPEAKKEKINKLIKRLNSKKTTRPDGIPIKIIKLSGDVIDKHLTSIINSAIERTCFSKNVKIASVKSINKKESRSDKNNSRPVSILNGFSKICECFINDKLLKNASDILLILFLRIEANIAQITRSWD